MSCVNWQLDTVRTFACDMLHKVRWVQSYVQSIKQLDCLQLDCLLLLQALLASDHPFAEDCRVLSHVCDSDQLHASTQMACPSKILHVRLIDCQLCHASKHGSPKQATNAIFNTFQMHVEPVEVCPLTIGPTSLVVVQCARHSDILSATTCCCG